MKPKRNYFYRNADECAFVANAESAPSFEREGFENLGPATRRSGCQGELEYRMIACGWSGPFPRLRHYVTNSL